MSSNGECGGVGASPSSSSAAGSGLESIPSSEPDPLHLTPRHACQPQLNTTKAQVSVAFKTVERDACVAGSPLSSSTSSSSSNSDGARVSAIAAAPSSTPTSILKQPKAITSSTPTVVHIPSTQSSRPFVSHLATSSPSPASTAALSSSAASALASSSSLDPTTSSNLVCSSTPTLVSSTTSSTLCHACSKHVQSNTPLATSPANNSNNKLENDLISSTSLHWMLPAYPSWKLIFRQLKLSSLWDRLFTHCTGRDLLCKLIQHFCGVLRCVIHLWRWVHARMMAHERLRRFLFGPHTPAERLLQAAKHMPAVMAVAPIASKAGVAPFDASSPALPLQLPLPLPVLTDGNVDGSSVDAARAAAAKLAVLPMISQDDAFQPPSLSSPLSTRLAHISYTMYRARQVLRLGRWLYDIPDVRDSAIELFYGTTREEKSKEEQEEAEEWEEHERVYVVRSRRASLDWQQLRAGLTGATNVGMPTKDARGTFTFPINTRLNATSLASTRLSSSSQHPARRSLPPRSKSMTELRTLEFERRFSTASTICGSSRCGSGASSTTSVDDASETSEDSDTSQRIRRAAMVHSEDDDDDDDEEESDSDDDDEDDEADESMTLFEWSIGVIDLSNSLMGLILDACDDIDFISSLGFLPERVGDVAGRVSSFLWCISSVIDVGMCMWKMHVYKQEMQEAWEEKREEWRLRIKDGDTRRKHLMQLQQVDLSHEFDPNSIHDSPSSPPTHPAAWAHMQGGASKPEQRCARCANLTHAVIMQESPIDHTSSASVYSSIIPASTPSGQQQLLLSSTSVPHSAPLSLCTADCDLDCFHIEYLRFYRYLCELLLCIVGFIDDAHHVQDMRLECVREAAGLCSGLATLIKKGATHARSKAYMEKEQAKEARIKAQQIEQEALYT